MIYHFFWSTTCTGMQVLSKLSDVSDVQYVHVIIILVCIICCTEFLNHLVCQLEHWLWSYTQIVLLAIIIQTQWPCMHGTRLIIIVTCMITLVMQLGMICNTRQHACMYMHMLTHELNWLCLDMNYLHVLQVVLPVAWLQAVILHDNKLSY